MMYLTYNIPPPANITHVAVQSPAAANILLGSPIDTELRLQSPAKAAGSAALGASTGEKRSPLLEGGHHFPRFGTPYMPLTQEVAHTSAQNVGFMHGMSNTINITPNGSASTVFNSLPLPSVANTGDTPSLPTREELIAFGGISEPAFNGIRSSDRLRAQPNADASQLERAMQLAQQRDNQGKASVSKLSITSLSNDEILSRVNKLGVSFGKSSTEVANSINLLKAVEKEREFNILEHNKIPSDDDPHNLFVSKVSGLCEDLTEEEEIGLEDHTDHICQEAKSSLFCSKRVFKVEQPRVRRSARIKKIQKKKS
jgi:hypothetical protein